jgi:hypothetical protein
MDDVSNFICFFFVVGTRSDRHCDILEQNYFKLITVIYNYTLYMN